MLFITNLWWLLVAHAVTDVVGQTERMEFKKQRSKNPETWFCWLLAHGLLNGLGVYIASRHVELAMAETLAHMLIDFGKNEGTYGVSTDQCLHLLSKVGWVWLVL